MKRILFKVILSVLLFSFLCGCAKSGKPNDKTGESAAGTINGYTNDVSQNDGLQPTESTDVAEIQTSNEATSSLTGKESTADKNPSSNQPSATNNTSTSINTHTSTNVPTSNNNNSSSNTTTQSNEDNQGFLSNLGALLQGFANPNNDYYKHSNPAGNIEKKYTDIGPYSVSTVEYELNQNEYKKCEVWYPTELETSTKKYPMVIMANGTGITASKYKEVFNHLASWGFIVVGNEDENSWSGDSSSVVLNLMLEKNSEISCVFYKKVDTKNIGIAGHSQGGVGAINAVTNQKSGKYYKAMWTASTTHIALSDSLGWPYDVSKVKIPYIMVAGTGVFDAGDGVKGSSSVGIAPLFSLQENYNAISTDVTKVMARQKGRDHGDMLRTADGYMTAWFMYWLNGDKSASQAFFGNNAELLGNTNWQDVKIN